MHQQRFNGVAGTRALGFGVDDNLQGRRDLCAVIHHDMTHANPAGDHRNGRLFAAQLVQARPTAWDQHVDVFIHAQHFIHQRTIRAFDSLYRTGWQAALFQRLLDDVNGGRVGSPRLFAPAQNGGVTGFQAQGGDVDGHVRARFINHADHTEWDAATLDAQTAVEQPAVNHLPHRIGEVADLAHVIRDAFKTCGRQSQAVEHCLAQTIVTRVGQILFVGEQDLLRLCFQIISDFFQNAVFLAAGKERQFVRGGFGSGAHLFQHDWLLSE
ncbi:hypothetical protein D3C72_967480 [compost metagenome]